MTREKYYAVVKGRKPGIYDKWFGTDGAEAQIKGFSGAIYKGFRSYKDAADWMENPCINSSSNQTKACKSSINEKGRHRKVNIEKTAMQPHASELEKGKTIIYADGGCLKNPGPGGYGVVVIKGQKRKELSGGFSMTTNNRMELTACIKGLEMLEEESSAVIYSDSLYVVNGIKKGWAKRWQANNWYRNNSEKAENADLWARLLELCEKHEVDFVWVRGHNNIKENVRCDRLSYWMAQRSDLPSDRGYDTGIIQ